MAQGTRHRPHNLGTGLTFWNGGRLGPLGAHQSAQELRSNYGFANRQIEINLKEAVDGIQIKRDEDILGIKNDLSKSEQDIYKEVFNLQKTADKNTLNIINAYKLL